MHHNIKNRKADIKYRSSYKILYFNQVPYK